MPTITDRGYEWHEIAGRSPARYRTFAVDPTDRSVYIPAALLGPPTRVVEAAWRDDRRVIRDRGAPFVPLAWAECQTGANVALAAVVAVIRKELRRCQ